jgi:hypothetical protein
MATAGLVGLGQLVLIVTSIADSGGDVAWPMEVILRAAKPRRAVT